MNTFKKLLALISLCIPLFFFATFVFAAAPDGAGPWADNVVSSSQGLMKNGAAVPAIRSNPSAALGVAEGDTVDGNFFSLGFGGNIVLGFDNGISNGVMVVEATNPDYPGETALIEMSEDGATWLMAGTLVQDGTVEQPEDLVCARYARITDISDPEIMPDDIADGYDVDGVQAMGDPCPEDSPTPTPTSGPSNPGNPGNPGLPNTGSGGPSVCSSPGVPTVPVIIQATRTSPTSIFVAWGPDAGFDDFVVQYGFENGVWLFNTNVSGFSTTINDLPNNQSIWIQVAATDGCATGSFGTPVLVGGTPQTNTPGFPNTGGVPGLPNTGIGPDEN